MFSHLYVCVCAYLSREAFPNHKVSHIFSSEVRSGAWPTMQSSFEGKTMEQFFKISAVSIVNLLNAIGSEGWEMVSENRYHKPVTNTEESKNKSGDEEKAYLFLERVHWTFKRCKLPAE